jgi:guanine deaminase
VAERILVAGGLVMPGAEAQARPADILIEDGTIRGLLTPDAADKASARRIDAAGMLVMPGLINAHTHGHGGLSKGAGDRWSLELLLNAGPYLGGHRTDDDRYVSTAISAVEMLRKGCTACYDLALFYPAPTVDGLHAVAQAYADIGIRAVVAPMIADRTLYQAYPGIPAAAPPALRATAEAMRAPDPDATLATIAEAARSWPHAADHVRLGIAPTIPLHCSDAFLRACAALADPHGMPLQTHLAESRIQQLQARAVYGMSLTAHLDRMNLLGPGFSAAHAIWLDDAELELLAEAGAAIAHNPGSNLRLGNGIADIRPMLARGLRVGVGTDGSASSDNQNMFEAMRLAAFVSRVHDRPAADWIGAQEAIGLATEGSAAVLGLEGRVGRIAPGWLADLVFLDLGHVNWVPLNNAANQAVNTEDGSAVRHVMVGGRMVLQDGVVTGLDWPGLAARAHAAAARLREANAETQRFCTALEPVVAQFCAGLVGCGHGHGLPNRLLRRTASA